MGRALFWLRRIAREGRRAFYEGEVAEDMLTTLNAMGGVHTAEDFAAANAMFGSPVTTVSRGQQKALDEAAQKATTKAATQAQA